MSLSDRRTLLAALAVLALPGCGFQLRQRSLLNFQSIALSGFAPRSPLAEDLKRALAYSVRVVDTPAQAEVVLHALVEQREKSVVASTSAAQVREFQLRLRLTFRASTPAGRELVPQVELVLARDLTYSESLALGKEQEEGEIYREMQADVASQVLRRLSSIKL